MNREIKFRLVVLYEGNNHINLKFYDLDELMVGVDKLYETKYNKIISKDQYTGLKDKLNRNEVYEHDILQHPDYGFLKVEWDYRDAGWVAIDSHYKKFNLVNILLLGAIRVGNIYENKELLDNK